jgi:hypothetical protein
MDFGVFAFDFLVRDDAFLEGERLLLFEPGVFFAGILFLINKTKIFFLVPETRPVTR